MTTFLFFFIMGCARNDKKSLQQKWKNIPWINLYNFFPARHLVKVPSERKVTLGLMSGQWNSRIWNTRTESKLETPVFYKKTLPEYITAQIWEALWHWCRHVLRQAKNIWIIGTLCHLNSIDWVWMEEDMFRDLCCSWELTGEKKHSKTFCCNNFIYFLCTFSVSLCRADQNK